MVTKSARAAYRRGYTMAGANPYQGAAPGIVATAEHLAFELGKADRAAGRPARPASTDKLTRLVALLALTRQGELLAEVEPIALDTNSRGPLI